VSRGKRNGNREAVLQLTLRGLTAREIGDLLGIAMGTVYAHRYALRIQGRL
jgi:DNA-binding CsgD family transcriptional regulator